MNKEEILEKAKKENVYGDEREKKIRIQRDAFSLWGFLSISILIMIIKLFRTQSPSDIISILFCTTATAFLYEAIKTKKKIQIVLTIGFYILAVYYFYRFCAGLF